MKRPRMSTGAWIFTGLVTAAVVAPTAVYAAANSTVAIGNPSNAVTATVTANHQLLTVPVAPKNIVRFTGATTANTCTAIYTPPAGKAIVITEVTYLLGSGTSGTAVYASVRDGCAGSTYDWAETAQRFDTQSRTFPVGLPLSSVGLSANGSNTFLTGTGYLIAANQLPASEAGKHRA